MDIGHKSELRTLPTLPTGQAGGRQAQNSELRLKGTTIFFITNNGLILAKRLKKLYPDADVLKFKTENVKKAWNKSGSLFFIMASGIAVRSIASLIKDKKTDPAVVVLDEKGEYAISLLSGHLGGANKLANEVADFLGGRAVITTASDINNLTAIDLWAKENNLAIENWNLLPKIATKLINNGRLNVCIEQDSGIKLPAEFLAVKALKDADVIVTSKAGGLKALPACRQAMLLKLFLRPKNLVVGIGCNTGTPADEIESAVRNTLKKSKLSFLSVHSIATIDKKGKEPGLTAFAKKYNFKISTFTPDELNSAVSSLNPSAFNLSPAAYKATGAKGVAEPAALLAAGADELLVPKQKIGNVTVAIAELKVKSSELRVKSARNSKLRTLPTGRQAPCSRLYIVGTGPGGIEHITPEAQRAIKESDVIVGYGTYLDLIQNLIKDKEVVSTGMTQEIDRCKKAVELALSGKNVSVISGGDPGIYAMAGLVFETLKNSCKSQVASHKLKNKCYGSLERNSSLITRHSSLSVEVIPGISALNACAARLGAPLMHDFASISLSDRLTPWKLIKKRLGAAAMADFVIVLYNPKSKGRAEHINKAREIILKNRNPGTPVGIVKGAMRDNEKMVITSLKDMPKHDIDMQTTVIIGNSQTYIWKKWMITPRGYEKKFKVYPE